MQLLLVLQAFTVLGALPTFTTECELLYSRTTNQTVSDVPEGRNFEELCRCTGSSAQQLQWTKDDVEIPDNYGDVTLFSDGLSSYLKIENITKDKEGVVCCHQKGSLPACVRILVHRQAEPPTLLATLANVTRRPHPEAGNVSFEGQVQVQCRLKAHSKYQLESGSMFLLVNNVLDSRSFDLEPEVVIGNGTSGTPFYTMIYEFKRRVNEGDAVACQWIDQNDIDLLVTPQLTVYFPGPSPDMPATPVPIAAKTTSVSLTTQLEHTVDYGRDGHLNRHSTSSPSQLLATPEAEGHEHSNDLIVVIASVASVLGVAVVALVLIIGVVIWVHARHQASFKEPTAAPKSIRKSSVQHLTGDSERPLNAALLETEVRPENRSSEGYSLVNKLAQLDSANVSAACSRASTRCTSPVNVEDEKTVAAYRRDVKFTRRVTKTKREGDDLQQPPGLYCPTTQLTRISECLGDSWKALGRQLRILEPKLQNIQADYNGQQEMAYQMLYHYWINTDGANRVGLLRQAVENMIESKRILDAVGEDLWQTM